MYTPYRSLLFVGSIFLNLEQLFCRDHEMPGLLSSDVWRLKIGIFVSLIFVLYGKQNITHTPLRYGIKMKGSLCV